MNATQFFRWIWRINGVVILAVVLIGGFVALYGAVQILIDLTRPRQVQNTARVEDAGSGTTVLSFGAMEEVTGTPVVILPLYSSQKERLSGSYKTDAAATRNLHFYNAETGIGKWIFPQNDLSVIEHRQWTSPDSGKTLRTTRWLSYLIVKADTNGDGLLTTDDEKTFAVSDANGDRYSELLTGVERLLGTKLVQTNRLLGTKLVQTNRLLGTKLAETNRLLVFYTRKAGASQLVEINLETQQIVRDTNLSTHPAGTAELDRQNR